MSKLTWPAWFNGPKGETAVFESPEDVPNGWTSGAEKQSAKGEAAKAPKSPEPPKEPAKEPAKAAGKADLDADGHPYNPELHAATKSKTKAGLWRMKVGVSRPAPAPGYPLDL